MKSYKELWDGDYAYKMQYYLHKLVSKPDAGIVLDYYDADYPNHVCAYCGLSWATRIIRPHGHPNEFLDYWRLQPIYIHDPKCYIALSRVLLGLPAVIG